MTWLSLVVFECCILIFAFLFWALVSGGSPPFVSSWLLMIVLVHCHLVVYFWHLSQQINWLIDCLKLQMLEPPLLIHISTTVFNLSFTRSLFVLSKNTERNVLSKRDHIKPVEENIEDYSMQLIFTDLMLFRSSNRQRPSTWWLFVR